MASDLTLSEEGSNFILRIGDQKMVLTPSHLLDFANSAMAIRARVLLQQSAKSDSAQGIVVTPVKAALAWTGAMRDSVLLSLQTFRGEDITFSLSVSLAEKILQELPDPIRQVESENRTLQ